MGSALSVMIEKDPLYLQISLCSGVYPWTVLVEKTEALTHTRLRFFKFESVKFFELQSGGKKSWRFSA